MGDEEYELDSMLMPSTLQPVYPPRKETETESFIKRRFFSVPGKCARVITRELKKQPSDLKALPLEWRYDIIIASGEKINGIDGKLFMEHRAEIMNLLRD